MYHNKKIKNYLVSLVLIIWDGTMSTNLENVVQRAIFRWDPAKNVTSFGNMPLISQCRGYGDRYSVWRSVTMKKGNSKFGGDNQCPRDCFRANFPSTDLGHSSYF